MLRRTLHKEQLPSHMTLKRRRAEPEASEVEETLSEATKSAVDNTPTTRDAPAASAVPPTSSAKRGLDDIDEGDSSDDEDDLDALMREKEALEAKRRKADELSVASTGASSARNTPTEATRSVSAYNSDVLFRRNIQSASTTGSTKKEKDVKKYLRHSNLEKSDDHTNFLQKFFK